ncbi:ParA family protein [Aquisalimonas sp. 2447]|uniref:ParA family protein n=1 Tax=Aquisalimonas sp. 2447 TaxID=2740807 RepID=UPI0014327A93|nr:ParA family protein [Aquisalimonas sp. 2447]QIT55546.1 ParA family protein [Aquisalimonas sp. 2447]
MRRVIFNQKGGVGKSTITCNLAAISAHQGLRTLVVDLDSQGNSSSYLLGREATPEGTLADYFDQLLSFRLHQQPLTAFVHETPFNGLHVMPASRQLDELQGKLESRYKIYKLREALEELSDSYDAIYMDTPPALNFYTRSALIAAERCLIPFDCDDFSRYALYDLLEALMEIREDHNGALAIEGIIVNQYNARANVLRQAVEELQGEGHPVLQPYIASSVKIKESHEKAVPLIQLAPRHKVTAQYLDLFETLQRNQ